jgi:hypothetical protein
MPILARRNKQQATSNKLRPDALKAEPESVFVQLARFGRIDAGRQPVHSGQERRPEKSTTDFQSVAGGSSHAGQKGHEKKKDMKRTCTAYCICFAVW